jgi:hypothetical protein
MLKINKVRFFIALFTILFFSLEGFSQPGLSSPYTFYGIGYLSRTNNVRNMAMGGIGIGTRNPISLNLRNAASLTAIDSNSFLFEGAAIGYFESLQTENVKENMTSGSLSHLILGFPIMHWWKTSVGILPYSNVNYTVISFENKDNIGKVQYEYAGSGGLNQFYWSNGFKLHKNFSIGLNASYIFGTTDKTQKVTFPDSVFYISSQSINSTNISDISLEFSAQYHAEIKHNLNLVVGGVYQPKIDMSAKKSYLSQTFLGELNQIIYYKDTVSYTPDEKGSVVFPTRYGFGGSLESVNKWMVGVDFTSESWEDYSCFGEKDSLNSSYLIAVGGEYIPNINSTSYLNRIDYRLGAKYNHSALKLRGQQLNNFGITFGLGLPIRSIALRRSKAMINLGFEVGTRGTLENNLIQENYINFHFGVLINEFWFQKRKYN